MKFLFLFVCAIAALHTHYSGHAAQLRRVWMQDHCQQDICTDIEVGGDDYVILSQMPISKQLLLTFLNSSIAKIPNLLFDTFPNLQVLRMENCSVETFVEPQFMGASKLRSLFLGHNLLRDIPANIFIGADTLHTLHLNHNQLVNLHDASFIALKELLELSLADNRLAQLPPDVFVPLRKLSHLNLGGNRITVLPPGIFDTNSNLTRINLSRNRFVVFQSELFDRRQRLKQLDLSGNELHDLTLKFDVLESLVANNCDMRKLTIYGDVYELELRNNSLRQLPYIPRTAKVISLDVSLNPLGTLHNSALQSFTGLQRLNLSATGMHELDQELFYMQSRLKLLDISSNSLYNFKYKLFGSLKSLQYFYFQQNNWNCDFLQLLMNSFVKKRDISYMEDATEPELVDDYVDGVACWYESNKATKKCSGEGLSEAALELSIVRNDIKSFTEAVERKFVKVYRMLDELKMRL